MKLITIIVDMTKVRQYQMKLLFGILAIFLSGALLLQSSLFIFY